MSGKQIITDFLNFFFIVFYYSYRICIRSFKSLPRTVEMLWFNWVELTEIPCQVSRSSPIFLIFFSLYSTIATESAYEVSSRCLGRLKGYDLVGWIWVELTEISCQVSRSSPSLLNFFFIAFWYSYKIYVWSFNTLSWMAGMLWFSWADLVESFIIKSGR